MLAPLAALALVVMASACESSSSVDPSPQGDAARDCSGKGAGDDAGDSGEASLTAAPDPAFNQDILPILSSSGGERDYKCTNCHPLYNQYSEVANEAEFARILAQIKAKRMPLGPARVTPADYALLKRWRATGFKLDRPVTAAEKARAETERDAGAAGTDATKPCN
jgi:hypothetical protein